MQDVIADALLWAAAQGHVDGKNACITGAEWLVFSEEGQGWRKPENQLIHARRFEAFPARHRWAENPGSRAGQLK